MVLSVSSAAGGGIDQHKRLWIVIWQLASDVRKEEEGDIVFSSGAIIVIIIVLHNKDKVKQVLLEGRRSTMPL